MTEASQRVLRIAAERYAWAGVTNVSMRDLAKELNIQAPSIYSHFPSKGAVVSAILKPYVAECREIVSGDFPSESLPGFYRRYADVCARHVYAMRIAHYDPSERRRPEILELEASLVSFSGNLGQLFHLAEPALDFIRSLFLRCDQTYDTVTVEQLVQTATEMPL